MSTTPEPQMPTGSTPPMVWTVRGWPSDVKSARSIAPSAAFMPQVIWYPSKAGPDAQLVTDTLPWWTSAISVLVPMSTAMAGRRFASRCVDAMTARQSEPTNPAMGGMK